MRSLLNMIFDILTLMALVIASFGTGLALYLRSGKSEDEEDEPPPRRRGGRKTAHRARTR